MKKCSTCKDEFPATSEHFHRSSEKLDGFDSRCKSCKRNKENISARRRRDSRRYEKLKNRCAARDKANRFYKMEKLNCAVLNCSKISEELHHVTYEDPLAVIPLCTEHHRMNHELVNIEPA